MKIISKVSQVVFLLIFCNFVFTTIYVGANFLPKDQMLSKLQKADDTGVLKTPINSIERATTGWGIDYGTECVALSIGLKDKQQYIGLNKYFSRFYDGFSNMGAAEGVFDPCSGLDRLVNSSSINTIDPNLQSYARNWWGMSIAMQILYLLFGLALAKTYLFILGIALTFYFYQLLSRALGNNKVGIYFLAPLILFADFQEIHNSYPFMLFYIQMILTGVLILKLLESDFYSGSKIVALGIICGSIYNFVFWLDFHMVITFSALTIFLATWHKHKTSRILSMIFLFESAWILGFVFTTIYKWTLSSLLFGSEVRESIFSALGVRLSSSSGGLNAPLSEYSQNFSTLPVPVRAIIINFMAFASKFVDPRNSSLAGVLVIFLILISFFYLFLRKYRPWIYVSKFDATWIFVLACFPIFYFLLTPNHSFNHAVVTYRAIPISLGFLLAITYQGSKYASMDMGIKQNQ
jgi:hypothetical protein